MAIILAATQQNILKTLAEEKAAIKDKADHARQALKRTIAVRKGVLKYGMEAYLEDTNLAESMWVGISNKPPAKIEIDTIHLELSDSLEDAIRNSGKVTVGTLKKQEPSPERNNKKSFLDINSDPNNNNKTITSTPRNNTKNTKRTISKQVSSSELIKQQIKLPVVDSTFSTSFVGADSCLLASLKSPRGICWSGDDGLLVCDSTNSAIKRVTWQGIVSTVIQHENLKHPYGIAVYNRTKDIFFTNQGMHNIIRIFPDTSKFTVFAGSGKYGYKDGNGTCSSFSTPTGITIDQNDGTLFVSDFSSHRIRRITPTGEVSTLAGSSEGYEDANGKNAKFANPHGICFDEIERCLIVCDNGNCKLRKVTLNGDVSTLCEIPSPKFVVLAGTKFLVSAQDNIFIVTRKGEASKLQKNGEYVQFDYPTGLVVHQSSCYVAECWGHRITKITTK